MTTGIDIVHCYSDLGGLCPANAPASCRPFLPTFSANGRDATKVITRILTLYIALEPLFFMHHAVRDFYSYSQVTSYPLGCRWWTKFGTTGNTNDQLIFGRT